MNKYSYKRKNCRLCNSKSITKVLDIPSSQPVDGFREQSHQYLSLPRFGMDLYICNECGHHQLLDVIDPDILYGSYIYTSSSSPDLEVHFSNYASYLNSLSLIPKNISILDIGCNDGLFLKKLKKFNDNLYGLDPAPNIKQKSKEEVYKLYEGYCSQSNIQKILNNNNIKDFGLITANNVFAHADNLEEMLDSISSALNSKGYFCFEVSYILDMVESKVVDYIYHEHLSYHGIKSLEPFLKKKGLYIFDIKRIKTKGGSIRVICSKESSKENKDLVKDFIKLENDTGCYLEETFSKISSQIEVYKKEIFDALDDFDDNLFIYSYGAAPTSIVNSLLLDYENRLSAYIDDNPIRQNKLSPNTFVPVLSSEIIANTLKPIVIIGAWRFSELIIPKIYSLNKNSIIIIPSLTEGIIIKNND